jgi:hypothetical protein
MFITLLSLSSGTASALVRPKHGICNDVLMALPSVGRRQIAGLSICLLPSQSRRWSPPKLLFLPEIYGSYTPGLSASPIRHSHQKIHTRKNFPLSVSSFPSLFLFFAVVLRSIYFQLLKIWCQVKPFTLMVLVHNTYGRRIVKVL